MLKYSSCADWHGTSYSSWLGSTNGGFVRGSNGVFAFDGDYGSWTDEVLRGRGVAVIGTGL